MGVLFARLGLQADIDAMFVLSLMHVLLSATHKHLGTGIRARAMTPLRTCLINFLEMSCDAVLANDIPYFWIIEGSN